MLLKLRCLHSMWRWPSMWRVSLAKELKAWRSRKILTCLTRSYRFWVCYWQTHSIKALALDLGNCFMSQASTRGTSSSFQSALNDSWFMCTFWHSDHLQRLPSSVISSLWIPTSAISLFTVCMSFKHQPGFSAQMERANPPSVLLHLNPMKVTE